MHMFISPTLQRFCGPASQLYTTSGTPLRTACVLFNKLLGCCPDLRNLELVPHWKAESSQTELPFVATSLDIQTGYTSQVAEMTITLPLLFMLTNFDGPPFPVLERLCVYTERLYDMHFAASTRNLFPQLRKLVAIHIISEKVLHEIWRALGSAANQLTHIKLDFESTFWHEQSTVLRRIFSFLIIYSPRVVDLSIDPTVFWLETSLVPEEIMLLNKLPLERLCIKHRFLHGFLPPSFRPGQAFSQLKVLELPDYRMAPVDLPRFAEAMPILEHLSVDLQLGEGIQLYEHNVPCRSTALRRLESKFNKITDAGDFGKAVLVSKFAGERYAITLEFTRYVFFCLMSVLSKSSLDYCTRSGQTFSLLWVIIQIGATFYIRLGPLALSTPSYQR